MNSLARQILFALAFAYAFVCLAPLWSRGQTIFADDFDDFNAASRFSTPFSSTELEPPVFDGFVDYAFDYGALAGYTNANGTFPVPSAPNSTGGSTIGIAISVNPTDDGPIDEGEAIGVSPLIASLAGDYTVIVDAYIYYPGGGGASEHAVLGVNADKTAVPYTFRPAGAGQFYHVPHDSGLANPGFIDDYYRMADGVQTELYDGDDEDADPAPDASTTPLFPDDGTDPVFGDPGFPGNQWMELRLTRGGNILNFYVNGFLVDTYDTTGGSTGGDIVIGGSDIYNSANAANLILFDNLRVETGVIAPPSSDNADFNADLSVDGTDFLTWQKNYPVNDGTALLSDGDANDDGNVDDLDLAVWRVQYGIAPPAEFSAAGVPEPASCLLAVAAIIGAGVCRYGRNASKTSKALANAG